MGGGFFLLRNREARGLNTACNMFKLWIICGGGGGGEVIIKLFVKLSHHHRITESIFGIFPWPGLISCKL